MIVKGFLILGYKPGINFKIIIKRIKLGDVLNKEQRHKCMSNVRNKNTKPEIMVRKFLFSRGFRFRINKKDLPGKPDIVLPKYKTIIFINGCFWHGHENCKHAVLPVTNHEFWKTKISINKERDKEVRERLTNEGWRVIDIWQCQLKPKTKEQTLNHLISILKDE